MLKKLIRHEYRATSRIMWPVFLGMLALTVVMRIMIWMSDNAYSIGNFSLFYMIYGFMIFAYICALFALALTPLVLTAVRWRNHVLRDEGYLTLTLPVSIDQLLLSKLIVSAVWYAAAFLVAFLSLFIVLGSPSFFHSFLSEFIPLLISEYFHADGALQGHMLLIGLELLLNCVCVVSAAALMVYAAFSIGYSAGSHKDVRTTLLVLVFFLVAQFTALGMIDFYLDHIYPAYSLGFDRMGAGETAQAIELLLLWGLFGELLFAAAGYAMTRYFTTKKLNLE